MGEHAVLYQRQNAFLKRKIIIIILMYNLPYCNCTTFLCLHNKDKRERERETETETERDRERQRDRQRQRQRDRERQRQRQRDRDLVSFSLSLLSARLVFNNKRCAIDVAIYHTYVCVFEIRVGETRCFSIYTRPLGNILMPTFRS